jgi:crossover junction endodeoxyribonuclease RusA
MGGRPPLTGPVEVEIDFTLPRPKSARGPNQYPAKRPDLDKLVRAVLDALTDGGAWADDGQVVTLTAGKLYPFAGEAPGCQIRVCQA